MQRVLRGDRAGIPPGVSSGSFYAAGRRGRAAALRGVGIANVASDSTEKEEELDREHGELFHELRSIIPGAQVLFAFLLTVAFTNRFQDITAVQRDVYYATFLCAAVALVLLVAPAAYHRVQFRQRDKDAMMRIANVEALAATVMMVFSTAGTVFLITDLLFSAGWASVAAGAIAVLAAALWWGLPLTRRLLGKA